MEERGRIGGNVGNQEFFKHIGYSRNFEPFLQFHASVLWNKIMFMGSRFSQLSDLESRLHSLVDRREFSLI